MCASSDVPEPLMLHVSLDHSMSSESLQSQLSQGLLVKHPEFWFSDGSLILCAQSTLFRVHISQLCRKSVFFRDLFSLPQPSPPEPNERQLEGCPVLDLHDSPEDVANLVRVIYDGPYVQSFFSLEFLFSPPFMRSSVSGPPERCNSTIYHALRDNSAEHLCVLPSLPVVVVAWLCCNIHSYVHAS